MSRVKQFTVLYTVSIEAEDEAEAIEKATDFKGGGHWEAFSADEGE